MKTVNHKKTSTKRKVKASLTIEASILIPIALFTILGGIHIGYDLFQQARNTSEIHIELEKLDPVDIVRKKTFIQQLKK